MAAHERIAGDLCAVSRLSRGAAVSRQSRGDKNAALMGYSDEAELLQKIMPHWTLHDLRRTGGTLMNEYDLADPHVVEAILNHISGKSKAGVAGVYNRAKYEAQKRRALDRWGDFVMEAASSHGLGGFAAVDQFTTAERKRILNGS
jgi:hypothetical protein